MHNLSDHQLDRRFTDRRVALQPEPSQTWRCVPGSGYDVLYHRQFGPIDSRYCQGHPIGGHAFGPPTHG